MAVRAKMSREDRAKQFMPFAALKGYEDALREKERILVPKIELTEETKAELDLKLRQIELKDIITVTYFNNGEYLQVTGMVSRIDTDARTMKVVNTRIPFEDIYDIQGEKLAEKMEPMA